MTDLNVQTEFDVILKKFQSRPRDNFTALIYGDFGSGKTTMVTTARKPIMIDFFDPCGWALPPVLKGIKEGWILPTDYSGDRMKSPTRYREWEAKIQERIQRGFFAGVGTYVIDSATTWSRALMNAITFARGREFGVPAIQDYLVQMNTMIDLIHAIGDVDCDFILTGHMEIEKDEDTGAFISGLALTKGLKQQLPVLFTEKWLLQPQQVGKKIEYRVLTQNNGKFKAATRIGGGIFEQFEKPNIRDMLTKAGYEVKDKLYRKLVGGGV